MRTKQRPKKNGRAPARVRAAKPKPVSRRAVSGVPRHNFASAKQPAIVGHVDATKDSVTAFLQPFEAYQRRLSPGLPLYGQNLATYGFWTRNTIVAADVPLGASGNYGTLISVVPSLTATILNATALDALGVASAFQPYNDPFRASSIVNFDSVVCAYQGFRVKNITAVLDQAGESLVCRIPLDDANTTYQTIRAGGNTFVKSAADPGVLMSMNFEGTSGMIPQTAGNIVDYAWHPPSAANLDSQSTVTQFRSLTSSTKPQQWEIEVVTYYLARPFSAVSAFFTPMKREVDMPAFDKALDRALARVPELSIARNAMPDDGPNPTIMEDLSSIWGGIQAVGRTASAVWSGLSNFFGLASHRRHATILSLFEDEKQYQEFLGFANHHSLETAVAAAVPPAPPAFTSLQLQQIRSLIADEEKFEVLSREPVKLPSFRRS